MPIKLTKHGSLWAAEVTPPHGQWQSTHPMQIGFMIEALRSIGCQETDIDHALRELVEHGMAEGVTPYEYSQWAEQNASRLRDALDGRMEVAAQPPSTEAWIALALFWGNRSRNGPPLPLRDVIGTADWINHAIPDLNEVAWAFLQMHKRGWLAEQGDLYGLTAEGRRIIEGIVDDESSVLDNYHRLENWISAHLPRGDG